MASSEGGARPKYQLIAAGLREAIELGAHAPGSRLPGENDVMAEHDVARATARQALAQLVNWGLAEARKGSGIYVRDFRPIIRESIGRLGSSTWPSGNSIWSAETEGRNLTVDQLDVSEVDAPDRVRALLVLPDDARTVLRSRRYVLDGKPVLLSRSWLPAPLPPAPPSPSPMPAPAGSTPASQSSATPPSGSTGTCVRSRMPLSAETERLAIAPGTPIVEICRMALDADGTPVEVNEMAADSSAYIFRYEYGN